jgi:hypothetical protein
MMLAIRPRQRTSARLAVAALLLVSGLHAPARVVAQGQARSEVPARLDDSTFWRLVTNTSEPDGYFRSDNFVSNETTFQHVIPELRTRLGTGGAYVGVGPDQNFTYLVALRPRIAFIVDIRRQNMLQHLLYKALMEMSPTRAEFLSRLFSRPRPATLAPDASADALLTTYAGISPDSTLFAKNFEAVRAQLVDRHKFTLSDEDWRALAYVHRAFYEEGPELTYNFGGRGVVVRGGDTTITYGLGNRAVTSAQRDSMFRVFRDSAGQLLAVTRMQMPMGRGGRMPTYGELMVETDAEGVQRGYLASEAHYGQLRALQQANLIVPVVGDFGGDRAVRGVGDWLRAHGATVSAFYTSNVEQYLFQSDAWQRYYANVATMPLDSSSVFIRAVFNSWIAYNRAGSQTPGPRSVTMLSPIREFLARVQDGRIRSYTDVIESSH